MGSPPLNRLTAVLSGCLLLSPLLAFAGGTAPESAAAVTGPSGDLSDQRF